MKNMKENEHDRRCEHNRSCGCLKYSIVGHTPSQDFHIYADEADCYVGTFINVSNGT